MANQSSAKTLKSSKIWDILLNLVPLVRFKKREKYLRRRVTFSKVTSLSWNFTKSNTPPWVFFTFFKWYNWYQIAQNTYRNQNFKLKYRHNLTFWLNYFAMHFRKVTCHTQYTSYSPGAHFYNFVPLFLIFH